MPEAVQFPKGSRVRYSRSFLKSFQLHTGWHPQARGRVISWPYLEEDAGEYRYVKWDDGSSGYVLSNNLELTGD